LIRRLKNKTGLDESLATVTKQQLPTRKTKELGLTAGNLYRGAEPRGTKWQNQNRLALHALLAGNNQKQKTSSED
jgi:hypothetical protein